MLSSVGEANLLTFSSAKVLVLVLASRLFRGIPNLIRGFSDGGSAL